MKVSSHQPNFIPWCGYFYKIALSDAFVIADDVDFSRKSYINRNRIKTPAGALWLTLPVKKAPLRTPINEMEITDHEDIRHLLGIIKSNYTRAIYFEPFYSRLEEVMLNSGEKLADINTALITLVLAELEIKTPLFKTSILGGTEGESTQRIISICRAMKADTYISGFGGQKYQSEDLMAASGISCQVYGFRHPVYKQLWGDFIPNMSVIDLLFNCGPEAGSVLKSKSE